MKNPNLPEATKGKGSSHCSHLDREKPTASGNVPSIARLPGQTTGNLILPTVAWLLHVSLRENSKRLRPLRCLRTGAYVMML